MLIKDQLYIWLIIVIIIIYDGQYIFLFMIKLVLVEHVVIKFKTSNILDDKIYVFLY